MRVDSDETQAVLSQLIASYNSAATTPRKVPFNPRNGGAFDGTRVLFGSSRFVEVVQGNQHQQSFPPQVRGVAHFPSRHSSEKRQLNANLSAKRPKQLDFQLLRSSPFG
jgi:hypothetical protein